MIALSAREFRVSTWRATRESWFRGPPVLTFPPLTAETFDPSTLQTDLLYVALHGLRGQPYWYGDEYHTAVTAEQVRSVRLPGTICYLANCWGIGAMLSALLDAGAACVVGDTDTNFAHPWKLRGANAMGALFLEGLRGGMTAGQALETARVRYAVRFDTAKDDALRWSMHLQGNGDARL